MHLVISRRRNIWLSGWFLAFAVRGVAGGSHWDALWVFASALFLWDIKPGRRPLSVLEED